MEEDSTTVEGNSALDTGAESITTTEQQTGNVADNLDTSASTDTSTVTTAAEDTSSATQFDTDIDEWATRTGRQVPTSDSERALLQEVRDGQREYSRAKQGKEVSQAVNQQISAVKPADQVDTDVYVDPLEQRTNELETRLANSEALRARSEYMTEKGVTLEESNLMGAFLKEKVEKGGKAAFDFWTDPANLEDWHLLAKARVAATTGTDTSEIEQAAALRERERIARESKANGPARNASSTQTGSKTPEQARLERFSSWD